MEEVTVTYKVFEFNELSEEAQKKVLDKHRDWNVEYDWWDSVYDMYQEDLKELGFNDIKIWFSGFSSQGDGACFDCKSFNLGKLIEALKSRIEDKRYRQYKRFLSKLDLGLGIRTINHHYSHENTRTMEVDFICSERLSRISELVRCFEGDLEELRYELCRKIYRSLEGEYEFLTSDECIRESIEANELKFLENGKIFN